MKDDYDPDSDDIKGNLRNKNIGKSVKKVKNRKKKENDDGNDCRPINIL